MFKLIGRIIGWCWYVLMRPFAYVRALLYALKCSREGEKQFQVLSDDVGTRVVFVGTPVIPMLVFASNYGRHVFFGSEISDAQIADLVTQYWIPVYRERYADDWEGRYTFKPDFWHDFHTAILIASPRQLAEQQCVWEHQKARVYEEQVKRWLDAGADVNAVIRKGNHFHFNNFREGWSVLMFAVLHQEYRIVRLLLHRGANVNYEVNGESALGIARAQENQTMADLLRQSGAEEAEVPEHLMSDEHVRYFGRYFADVRKKVY